MRALLDVNVLLALMDEAHTQHGTARDWLTSQIAAGWASCAITQIGFVRIISQPRYPTPVPPAEAIGRLATATAHEHHRFLVAPVSILDGHAVDPHRVLSSRQVTDVYLLALAVANNSRFVTFDRTIPLSAVINATPDNLVVLH